ncbi:hypothetical protein PFISCL1PPCAC_7966, partial [Pristionchus fissidentatus]
IRKSKDRIHLKCWERAGCGDPSNLAVAALATRVHVAGRMGGGSDDGLLGGLNGLENLGRLRRQRLGTRQRRNRGGVAGVRAGQVLHG